jgi:predicted RecA/RadA family phage recombinase
MADNLKFDDGRFLYLDVASGVESGDPVVVGQIPGVAIIDRDTAGKATIDTGGVYDLPTSGSGTSGSGVVAVGDKIYYKDGVTPPLCKVSSGVLFGYALEGTSGSPAETIAVKLLGSGA